MAMIMMSTAFVTMVALIMDMTLVSTFVMVMFSTRKRMGVTRIRIRRTRRSTSKLWPVM